MNTTKEDKSTRALERLHSAAVDRALTAKFEELEKMALHELERRARVAMRRDPSAVEFVMGMGAVFFRMKNGKDADYTTSRPALRPVFDLLAEWDDYLHLTGTPMRFTADGPVIKEWG